MCTLGGNPPSVHNRLWFPSACAIPTAIMRAHLGKDRFPARIVRFADADTVIILIELGWGSWVEKYVRLVNLDSWELDSADKAKARAARDQLDEQFGWTPCTFVPSTKGFDRWGRVRGSVLTTEGDLAKWVVDHRVSCWDGAEPLPEVGEPHEPCAV